MAHFESLDEQHPYYAIAAARMWQNPETKPVTTARFYWKFAAFNFIHKRIQESDGGFFENLGTLLAEKVRAQEQAEGPLPKKKDEAQETEDEDNLSEDESIEEPVEALLETDSDRDENEQATNFLIESMGWNYISFYYAIHRGILLHAAKHLLILVAVKKCLSPSISALERFFSWTRENLRVAGQLEIPMIFANGSYSTSSNSLKYSDSVVYVSKDKRWSVQATVK